MTIIIFFALLSNSRACPESTLDVTLLFNISRECMCESLLIKFRSTYSWATSIKPFLYWISTGVKVLCLLIWLKYNEKVITIHKSLLKVKLINVTRKWRMKYGWEMQQILIANNDLRKEGSIQYFRGSPCMWRLSLLKLKQS